MKTIFLFLIAATVLNVSSALAAETQVETNPELFCQQANCTEPMREVIRDYAANPNAPDITQGPWLSSGACWHIHPRLTPGVTHHGLFMFENTAAGPWSRGLFLFFSKSNPYEGWSVEQARARLQQSGGPGAPMTFTHDHAFWNYIEPGSDLSYWARANPATGETFLITRWAFSGMGGNLYAFCRMQKH